MGVDISGRNPIHRTPKLEEILTKDGLNVYAGHSEKGWVEVTINK